MFYTLIELSVFKCLIPIYIFLSIWMQILQLCLSKLLPPKKKKKRTITSCKIYSFLSRNFYVFFFLNSLKNFKKILSKFYTVITNPHPSTLMYIILFWSNLNFFYLSQFLSQSINSNVTLDFNFLQYQIALIWTC